MQHPSYLSIASPDVMAAWHQLERESELEPRLPRHAMARPVARARPSVAVMLLLPILALVVVAATAKVAPPLQAARHLRQALVAADPLALAAMADWDRLRANLAQRMLPPGPAQPYVQDLADQVAAGLATAAFLHETLRVPAGTIWPLPRPGTGGTWHLRLASAVHGPVEVTLAPDPSGRWLLVDLDLPSSAEAVDE